MSECKDVQTGWVLESVWEPGGNVWRTASKEEREQGLPPPGPHACHWKYDRPKEKITRTQLPPLEHQYYAHIGRTCPGPPPAYVSDCGLQALSFGRVQVPDLKELQSLRSLRLYGHRVAEMVQVSSLTRLRQLILVTGLREVPTSWSTLEQLEELTVPNVSGLAGFLECLPLLKKLRVVREYTQKVLPTTLGCLSSLQSLDLRECSSLQALPESLGNLSSLQVLNLSLCNLLEALPESLGSLSSLETLFLTSCYSLRSLPKNFGHLSSLQSLYLGGCDVLEALPESFSSLSSLRELDLSYCTYIEALPSLDGLVSLETLNLTECCALRDVSRSLDGLSRRDNDDYGY